MRATRLFFALCAVAVSVPSASAGTGRQASEDAVKAAFLPKFVRYIELPASVRPEAGQPFYLCVIGRDPFGQGLDRAAANEIVDGRPIAVRRFANADAAAVTGCHAAYVAGTNAQQTTQILATLRRQPTLTITDSRWGQPRGMIHFAVEGARVRFHIDDAAAAGDGIGISSRLLALAVDVKQRPQ
ncbi:YfiR family protein [Sphingomonas psychrotolerans]|uniref:DUF4154 domain-containing protein n=1 Tax=Sphingomonas psychrotolerans TaxID=1327635 RepID=A0A2K8MJB5_9SPHN|nr:YfiR family protein [Sphingomonas psychrotolerans]ATY33982.1 DUF4154 domain-containing protein [Sphingomonas psychrotolerans]